MDRQEQWLPVPGEDFIEASSFGRIRRLTRTLPTVGQSADGRIRGNLRESIPGRVLSPWMKNGYKVISYRTAGVTTRRYVHRLVAIAFVSGHFADATVDHLDGDRLNNRADNLAWVTLAENSRRQNSDGRGVPKGEKHPSAKLQDSDIPELFRLRAEGKSLTQIGAQFGVSGSLVHKITTGLRRKQASE